MFEMQVQKCLTFKWDFKINSGTKQQLCRETKEVISSWPTAVILEHDTDLCTYVVFLWNYQMSKISGWTNKDVH